MNILNSFKSAFRALLRNKMRSSLTSIGIIIGVASVIMMIGLGSSAKLAVRERIQNFGANGLSMWYLGKPIFEKDYINIKKNFSQVRYISPVIKMRSVPVRYSNMESSSVLFGVNNDFFLMRNWDLQYGRYYLDSEIQANENVAIIGSTLQRKLFGFYSSIGKIIIINNRTYRVVGVLTETGASFSGKDVDDVCYIPYTNSFIKFIGDRVINELYMATWSDSMVDELVVSLRVYLRTLHNLPQGVPDDFGIETSKDKLKLADYISQTLSYLLAGVASISLFVGGVGIMNIMLVSVSERTREIGIRLAIGAKKRDVLLQFLIESMTLSTVGGCIGIILGLLGYYAIVSMLGWLFIFSFTSIVISVVFSGAVGIFFGYYPAQKAASLKPIEALRYE